MSHFWTLLTGMRYQPRSTAMLTSSGSLRMATNTSPCTGITTLTEQRLVWKPLCGGIGCYERHERHPMPSASAANVTPCRACCDSTSNASEARFSRRELVGAPCLFLDGISPITSFLKDFQDLSLLLGDLMHFRRQGMDGKQRLMIAFRAGITGGRLDILTNNDDGVYCPTRSEKKGDGN